MFFNPDGECIRQCPDFLEAHGYNCSCFENMYWANPNPGGIAGVIDLNQDYCIPDFDVTDIPFPPGECTTDTPFILPNGDCVSLDSCIRYGMDHTARKCICMAG